MEEYLDIFNIDGDLLGKLTRSECHQKDIGVYHKAVWVWIKNSKNQYLVQKRSMFKKKSPGKWDMPVAGHVSSGESSILTCVREAQEELGVNVTEKDFIFLKEWVNQYGWELAQIYLLKLDVDIKDIKLQQEEVEAVQWLEYEDFVNLLYSQEFCEHAIEYKDWVSKRLKDK